jgi:hypothetical protein
VNATLPRTGPASLADVPHGTVPSRWKPRYPARAAIGILLMVASVLTALSIYQRVGHRRNVLVLTRNVLAGEQVKADDLRPVAVSTDAELRVVDAGLSTAMVGRFAKVRMLEGSLLIADSLQDRPLVTDGKALTTVTVPSTGVPVGLREGSRLVLTVAPASSAPGATAVQMEAFVATNPARAAEGSSQVAVSVEVPLRAVGQLGVGAKVAISVVDPAAVLPPEVIR